MVAVARPPLSARRAALLTRVATWGLVFAALRVVGEIFDLSWHLSREQQTAFLMPFPPGGLFELTGSTRFAVGMIKVALPLVLIVHLGPRRFPLTSIFVPYVIVRMLVGGGLYLIGYSHPAPPLWEFVVAAV